MKIDKPLINDLAEVLRKHLGEYPTDFVVIVNRRGTCQTFGAFESADKMNELLKHAADQAERASAEGRRKKIVL